MVMRGQELELLEGTGYKLRTVLKEWTLKGLQVRKKNPLQKEIVLCYSLSKRWEKNSQRKGKHDPILISVLQLRVNFVHNPENTKLKKWSQLGVSQEISQK